jgi:hypothetical protein
MHGSVLPNRNAQFIRTKNGLYGEVHSVTEIGHIPDQPQSRIWNEKRPLGNVNEGHGARQAPALDSWLIFIY